MKDDITKGQICSKITQLTRVIYVINAKNEEFQNIINSIITSYDDEIKSLTKTHQKEISKLKDKIKSLTSNIDVLADKKVSEIQTRSETSLYNIRRNYDAFIKETQDRIKIMQSTYDNKVTQMYNEINEIKNECAGKYEKLIEQNKTDKQNITKEKDDQIKKIINDMDKMKVNYERQIFELQNEKKSNLEVIRTTNEQKMKQKDITIQSKDKLIQTHKEEIKALKINIENKENEYQIIINNLHETQNELETVKTNHNKLQTQLTQQNELINELKNDNNTLKENYSSLTKEHSTLKEQSVQFNNTLNIKDDVILKNNNEIRLKNEKIKELNNSISTYQSEIQNYQNEIKQLQSKIESDDKSHKTKMSFIENNYTSMLNKLKEEKEISENKLKTLYDKTIDSMKNEYETQKKTYQSEIAKKNEKEIEDIKNKKQIQITSLENQIKQMQNELNTKNAKIKEQNEQIEKMNQIDIKNLLDKNTMKNEKEMNTLKKTLREEKETLESKHREELDRIAFQHTLALNEIQIKLDSQISSLKIENIQLKEKLEKQSTTPNSLNENQITSLISSFDDINKNISDLTDSLFIKQNETEGTPSEMYHKLKSGVLQKLMQIQTKNNSFKNELNGLKGNNNDSSTRRDTVNSTVSTAGSKNSNNKSLQIGGSINEMKKGSNINNISIGGKKAFKRMSTNKIVINAGGKK